MGAGVVGAAVAVTLGDGAMVAVIEAENDGAEFIDEFEDFTESGLGSSDLSVG